MSFEDLLGLNLAAVQLPYFLVAAAVIVGVVTLWDRPRECVKYLARLGIAAIVRLAIHTARPYVAVGFIPYIDPVLEYSFPSGHTAVLSALAFVAYRRGDRAGWDLDANPNLKL